MEKNNNVKIFTIFLIISLIIIIIMGVFIYKLYNDKQTANSKLAELNNEIIRLKDIIDSLKATDDKEVSIELSKEDKRILIEKSYFNYAWGTHYNGMAIFNDGTIYSWNSNDNTKDFDDYNINSAEGLKNFVLENGNLESKKVSQKDLEEIEKYIDNLKDSIKIDYPGADQGTTTISAWNSNGKEIKLNVYGDSVGENKTKNAQELLNIINKYLNDY